MSDPYRDRRAENQAEIEQAAADRLERQRKDEEARTAEWQEKQRTWRQRRDAQFKAERERRDAQSAARLESELRRRYVAAGGSVNDFDADRDELLRQYRQDVTLGKASPVVESDDYADPKRWGLT